MCVCVSMEYANLIVLDLEGRIDRCFCSIDAHVSSVCVNYFLSRIQDDDVVING